MHSCGSYFVPVSKKRTGPETRFLTPVNGYAAIDLHGLSRYGFMQRDSEEYFHWLALASIPGVGSRTFRRLLTYFGTPEDVFNASQKELLATRAVDPRIVSAIRKFDGADWVANELTEVRKQGFDLISLADESYPAYLREIPNPPPILYVNGRSLLEIDPAVGIVGSRNPTQYGLSVTRELSSGLANSGFTVVSGMALGIDTAAHEGALSMNGKTVAVLGSGLGKIYPARNERLYRKIAEQGAVISEFPVNALPEAYHFPVRNRIISGMTLGSVIVEATTRSGSLITARYAIEQGREVFAVPGSIRSFKSTGCHQLIKEGAKLVENVTDIIDELAPLLYKRKKIDPERKTKDPAVSFVLSSEERLVLEAVTAYPVHIDTITRHLQLDASSVSAMLLQLEIKGVVEQMPGKLFVRQVDQEIG
ncbi:MAG: DNA-processing protein DprA [Deltaproteobacteria bacterium]|nr:DNA-processing protein DprA [Deltaproteobacteria bacterium]